jgi:hypothetical protein
MLNPLPSAMHEASRAKGGPWTRDDGSGTLADACPGAHMAPEPTHESGLIGRVQAARLLSVSVSTLRRWESELPALLAQHVGAARLPTHPQADGSILHEAGAVRRAAMGKAKLPKTTFRRSEADRDAAAVSIFENGGSIARVVIDLRLTMKEATKLYRLWREGTPDGVLVPRKDAIELTAVLGTANAEPSRWVATARALRQRQRPNA